MSKLNQVIQIGEIEGDCRVYLEDYVYTYLKKQTAGDKKKYYLYGEKAGEEHLYIYGIADAPKMEQTYFKEYSFLGYLKIKEENQYWIYFKNWEVLIEGFFVFYAPNQGMQEYLVDHNEGKKEEENISRVRTRKLPQKTIPVKEVLVTKRIHPTYERNNDPIGKKRKAVPVGLLLVLFLVAAVFTTENGKKKLQIMGEIVKDNFSIIPEDSIQDELIIEERKIENGEIVLEEDGIEENGQDSRMVPTWNAKTEEPNEMENTADNPANNETVETKEPLETESVEEKKTQTEIKTEKEVQEPVDSTEEMYEEYIVKEGDTLAGICNKKYGSLSNMKKICTLNEINNADYIAPGQKIYLPK